MKTIDVNIATPVVTNNVQLISKIGSNLGTQFFKVDVRAAWQGREEGFERDKKAIETGEKKGFILNRSPKRLLAKNFLIAGTVLVKDPMNDDEIGIAINPHEDGTNDLFLPINESTLRSMGKTTAEAVAECVRGEKDHFFLDAKTLAKILNDAMRREISYLEEHILVCQKMLGTLKNDIADNENKAKQAEEAWIKSAIKPDVEMPNGPAIITVQTNED
jgi:hypothetical protein